MSYEEKKNRASAMYMDSRLTRQDYENLKSHTRMMVRDKIWPSYKSLQSAEQRCYPTDIQVTASVATINLHSLLNHLSCRILLTVDVEVLARFRGKKVVFIVKWGLDGYASPQVVKQRWNIDGDLEIEAGHLSDASVFQISMVPLTIEVEYDSLWVNEQLSSVRLCRPIKFEYKKESSVNTIKEYQFYEHEIKNLEPFRALIAGGWIKVSYHMKFTMIDGKVCNALSENTSSCCHHSCEALPVDMNDILHLLDLPIREEYPNYGLSPLHCRIWLMEHLWHLACNIDFKDFYARGDDAGVKLARKDVLQEAF
ncbi:hypothetical protein QAD02_012819 [Eretmocerus hayati]|uniref:Uncharacterized protein n=1 Tax=Eretmocerus hayati TaxID=131215 RepID=A0ACC2P0X9_9HYME|nr:hypothetical protein QAD02_012819 [Eretmocerus hayati]